MTASNGKRAARLRHPLLRALGAAAILAAVIAAGAAWFRWQCWGLMTTRAELTLPGLPAGFDGLRIVHLSDLHGHEYGEGNRDLLERVAAERPDLIVMTGDMIDRAAQLEMIPALADGLSAVAPTYYVTGNHEWATGTNTVRELKPLLNDHGVTTLTNRYEVLERNGDFLALAGVDDPNGFADQKTPEELAEEIAAAEPGLYTILLAHRNTEFERYAAAGYDLVLSGHGHGGIVRLPFTDGLLGADRRFLPTHTAGRYDDEGGSVLYVSRGLGNNTTPFPGFRLFNRPEVVSLTLRAG